jgi:ParB family transcriptional regulator, chromosome partitioning protein
MTDIINIALNQLTAWKGNVRKTQTKGFVDELAASIKAHGLQQNLIVSKDGKKYAVIAGGQRLKALQHLAKAGDIKPAHPVPCMVTAGETDATELSLAENVVRANMHPADQFDAFCKLIDKGATVTDVAARFGITETVVQQRLKLARVSPVILKAYRAEKLNLEQVMAFAISDDHEAQENVLDNLRDHYDTHPGTIRDALTENHICTTDRRVKCVTLKAYEKAGGTIRRDLFSQDDDHVFILNTVLLAKLLAEKLERAAQPVRAEGWKWVEVHPDFGYQEKSSFQRRYAELTPLQPEQQSALDNLQQEYDALYDTWSDNSDDEEQPERMNELEELIETFNDREKIWTPETLAIGGAVVTIGYNGKTDIERGLVRPEDAPKKTAKGKSSSPDTADQTEENPSPAFSAALIESLTAHKSAALSTELLQRPDIALAAVVHTFASRVLLNAGSTDTSLVMTAAPQSLKRVEGSKAFAQLEAARENWGNQIPGTSDGLWTWCLEQHQSVLLDLLAFCTATTINAVQVKADRPGNPRLEHADTLASALSLDMKTWFEPTAENYFSRISKPQILEALLEARATAPAPAWEKLKKSELAALAAREIEGKNWLPEPLRRR